MLRHFFVGEFGVSGGKDKVGGPRGRVDFSAVLRTFGQVQVIKEPTSILYDLNTYVIKGLFLVVKGFWKLWQGMPVHQGFGFWSGQCKCLPSQRMNICIYGKYAHGSWELL